MVDVRARDGMARLTRVWGVEGNGEPTCWGSFCGRASVGILQIASKSK